MKKTGIALLLIVGLIISLAPMALANQITIGASYGPYQAGQGGEFTLQTDMTWLLSYYSNDTKNQGGTSNSFQSFCVEYNEHIYTNTTYNVAMSQKSLNTNHSLTMGAAYLYHQFQSGTLVNYAYNGTTGQRKASALQLQNAIWYYMGETANSAYSATEAAYYKNIVDTALGAATALTASNGAYGVAVLNVWKLDGSAAQDMLVCVPEPLSLLLLGGGLISIAGLRRRLKK